MLKTMVILFPPVGKLKATSRNASCMDAPLTITPTRNHIYIPQEQQRELKKAQKETAKAKKKAAAGAGGDSMASPSSAARGVPKPSPNGEAGATAATVQFCAASPPTVAHATCSLTSTSMAFVLGEVRM